jgi:hypothetical protein
MQLRSFPFPSFDRPVWFRIWKGQWLPRPDKPTNISLNQQFVMSLPVNKQSSIKYLFYDDFVRFLASGRAERRQCSLK